MEFYHSSEYKKGDELYRQGVQTIIVNSRGEFLMLRIEDKFFTGWIFPSGGAEEGEDDRTTAYREIQEETGIAPGNLREVGVSRHRLRYDFNSDQMRIFAPYVGQEKTCFVFKFLGDPAAIIPTGTEDENVVGYAWVSGAEVEQRLDDPNKYEHFLQVAREFALLQNQAA